MKSHFAIAIDGPAASGKGTLARRIAAHYGFDYLDTGLTYRAVAKSLLDAGFALDDEERAEQVARDADLRQLDRAILSTNEVGEAASRVAVISAVRRVLVDRQREFAQAAPGVVLDGRDIGTVVCPDADVKFYLIADAQVRAERRWQETRAQDGNVSFDVILADINRRDARDQNRTDGPLKPANDAYLLDSGKMDINAVFFAACRVVDRVLALRNDR